MHKNHPLIVAAVAAFLPLAACNSEPETITGGPIDPQAEALNKAAPVELPPAIQASRTYRCKDNSLLYAEFLTNNTARVRADKGAEPTVLTAAAAGEAYVAEGYSLSGNGTNVDYTAPGKAKQSCKA